MKLRSFEDIDHSLVHTWKNIPWSLVKTIMRTAYLQPEGCLTAKRQFCPAGDIDTKTQLYVSWLPHI